MHKTVDNLISIKNELKIKTYIQTEPKIIAVSKTFGIAEIKPLIDYGHLDFGENKVQEAFDKWDFIKKENNNINLHLIGKLQSNKVKLAVSIFDFIHSVDNKKLAEKIANQQIQQNKKIKVFIQINIGEETQKTGIYKNQLPDFYKFCKSLKLDVIGIMCIPPNVKNVSKYFKEMSEIKKSLNFKEMSMGMSSDYLEAANYSSTYLRIGSKIFGERN